ncbi:ATPase AAA [Candidatus Magnetomorum sp. HK-1]|nr:ATPase AAA [Candidatus Magnetomorum sp. HK-1]
MKIYTRYIKKDVCDDIQNKMVFIGGARQVGKTTFSLSFLKKPDENSPAYMNWDDIIVRPDILSGKLPANQKIIILDEIHKFAKWRNLIKGFYDKNKSKFSFIITGSARLDYYSKGGDSLQGRYHYYRLHPFSLMEVNPNPSQSDVEQLLKFGGFPEPLLNGNEKFWRRWQRERINRVIYDDIRDLENIREISLLELLVEELKNRVASPLSIKKIKDLLGVAHETVERWIQIFERMYYCFRVPPFGPPKIRAVKKEQKLYLWDWSIIEAPGPKFENFIASQLLKYCHYIEDTQGYQMELRFLRDTDKREVDFVVIKEKKPIFAVECKNSDKKMNPALYYFKERTQIPQFFQVHCGKADYEQNGVRVLPVETFCKELDMP